MTGVESIVQMIEAKTAERIDQMTREAEEQREIRLKDARQKAAAVAEDIKSKAEKELKSELTKHEASMKLKAKYLVLGTKDKAVKDVLESAAKVAKKEMEGKKCTDILTRFAVEGGTALGSQNLEIVFPEKQKVTIDHAQVAGAISKNVGQKVTVTIAKDTVRASGGLIIRSSDGSKCVDNTFEARMERLTSRMRDEAARVLFQKKSE
jgi:V/A-type H+-transporting ATPase subunit E